MDVHGALHGQGSSSFNNILVGFNRHEPSTKAADQNQRWRLRIGQYCGLTRYMTQVMLFQSTVLGRHCIDVNYSGVCKFRVNHVLSPENRHWSLVPRDDFFTQIRISHGYKGR